MKCCPLRNKIRNKVKIDFQNFLTCLCLFLAFSVYKNDTKVYPLHCHWALTWQKNKKKTPMWTLSLYDRRSRLWDILGHTLRPTCVEITRFNVFWNKATRSQYFPTPSLPIMIMSTCFDARGSTPQIKNPFRFREPKPILWLSHTCSLIVEGQLWHCQNRIKYILK